MLGRRSPQGLGKGMRWLSMDGHIAGHIADGRFPCLSILTECLGKFNESLLTSDKTEVQRGCIKCPR